MGSFKYLKLVSIVVLYVTIFHLVGGLLGIFYLDCHAERFKIAIGENFCTSSSKIEHSQSVDRLD